MTERSWILVETFRGPGHEPTVLSVGQEPKHMKPLRSVIRGGGYLPAVRAMIDEVAATGRPFRGTTRDGRRQLAGDPLASFRGHVHGVYAWYGPAGEEPPPRPAAGAWYFNLTTRTTGGSNDLLDLYGEPPERRHQERYTAEAFGRLAPGPDEPGALALLVQAKPGMEYQGRRWTVRRDDGTTIFVNLWCRTVEEAGPGGRAEVVTRGITQAIGPAADVPSAPAPLVTIEQRVVAAEHRPGWHRAIVDHAKLALVKWLDPDGPMPGIAWEKDAPHKPAIHRSDLRRARQMSADLATSDRVEGVIRLRTTEGGWQAVHVSASLMLLDQHTTAALVTLSASSPRQGQELAAPAGAPGDPRDDALVGTAQHPLGQRRSMRVRPDQRPRPALPGAAQDHLRRLAGLRPRQAVEPARVRRRVLALGERAAGQDGRPHHAGVDARHADPVAAERHLLRERRGVAAHAELRGGVRGEARGRDDPEPAGAEHHAPGGRAEQVGQECVHRAHRAEQVRFDHPAGVIPAGRLHRAGVDHARRAEQQVNMAELAGHLLRAAGQRVLVSDVDGVRPGPRAGFLALAGGVRCRRAVQVQQRQERALAGETHGQRAADARPGARDDRHPARITVHARLTPKGPSKSA